MKQREKDGVDLVQETNHLSNQLHAAFQMQTLSGKPITHIGCVSKLTPIQEKI